MAEHQISLPEEAYKTLVKVAEAQGTTPVDWILSQLPIFPPEEQPLWERLTGLVGAINSKEEPPHDCSTTAFGEVRGPSARE